VGKVDRLVTVQLVTGEDGLSVWMLTSVEGNWSLTILRSHNFRIGHRVLWKCHADRIDLKPDGNEAKRSFDFCCVLLLVDQRWWEGGVLKKLVKFLGQRPPLLMAVVSKFIAFLAASRFRLSQRAASQTWELLYFMRLLPA